jgi:hypothetical protein
MGEILFLFFFRKEIFYFTAKRGNSRGEEGDRAQYIASLQEQKTPRIDDSSPKGIPSVTLGDNVANGNACTSTTHVVDVAAGRWKRPPRTRDQLGAKKETNIFWKNIVSHRVNLHYIGHKNR